MRRGFSMAEFSTPITLHSPHEKSKRVRDAQWVLNGHNFFGKDWLKSAVDEDWGLMSGQAADQARFDLGYPEALCHSQVFGQQLYNFLRIDGQRTKLPATYLARRKARLRSGASVKARALELAVQQIGYTESYGNNSKFGAWYGLNYNPWCAMFVTWCFVNAGDKKVFDRGARTAYAFWTEDQARVGNYGLRVTTSPEPGDVVVYHFHDGHTGIFEKWTDRSKGTFTTVEGNTSSSSEDAGGAVRRRDRSLSWCPTVFVRMPQ